MNVADIQRRIEAALEHAPDVRGWRDRVRDMINDHYVDLVASQRWVFRERVHEFHHPADQTFTLANLTFGNGFIDLTGVTGIGSFADHFYPAWEAGAIVDLSTHGALLPAISHGVPTDAGNPAGLDGQVTRHFATEYAEDVGSDLRLWLDSEFGNQTGNESVLSTAEAVVRVYRHILPWDCAEILSIEDRDDQRGPLRSMSTARETRWQLDEDQTGPPTHYLLTSSERGSYPARRDNYPNWLSRDLLHREAPVSPTFAATDSGAGTLAAGTYEFYYTWLWGGVESGPSQTVSVTIAASREIQLTNLEVATATFGGRHRVVYWRIGEEPFVELVRITNPTTATIQVDNEQATYAPFTNPGPAAMKRFKWGRGAHAEMPQFLRVHPRPAKNTRLFMRYLSMPAKVERDEDVLDVPREMRGIIVNRVVQEIAASSESNQARSLERYHQRKERERMAIASRRYLQQGGQRTTRASIHGDERSRTGIEISSITWTP